MESKDGRTVWRKRIQIRKSLKEVSMRVINTESALSRHRSIKVDVFDIDWDTAEYENYDDDGEILDDEPWNLPKEIKDMEITLYDVDPNTPLDELKEDNIGDIEEAIFSGLSEEYGFCVNMMDWKFVKYEVVKHETKKYYYVWDLNLNEEICDEDGNPYHFDTLEEANTYIDTLQELMNEK